MRFLRFLSVFGVLTLAQQAHAVQCEFSVKNEWNGGFNGSVQIINDGSATIDGWQVGLEFLDGTTISNAWNTDLAGNNPYTATSKSYNARVNPGSSKSFGFTAQKGTRGAAVSAPVLGGDCGAGSDPGDGANAVPAANATADQQSGSAPLTVSFDGSESQDADGDTLSYHWDFGDGTTSTDVSPAKTFDAPGSYSVSMFVSDGQDSSSTKTIDIVVSDATPASAACSYEIKNGWNSGFTAEVVIKNNGTSAINGWSVNLTYPDGSQISGTWNSTYSGSNPYVIENASYNGKIEPGQSTSFGFNAQRPHEGAPNVSPELGGICSTSAAVNEPPVAQIAASSLSGEAPFTVSFDGSGSSDADGDALSYQWLFGDGATASGANATHTFETAGAYEATLTVYDGLAESAPVSLTISVREPDPGDDGNSYQLNSSRSSLSFVSTKNVHVVETHRFGQLDGAIAGNGVATVTIALDTIDSGISIRDQRMRDHLFETALYGNAEISLNVDLSFMEAMTVGSTSLQTISPTLYLHGVNAAIDADVRIVRLTETQFLVQSTAPVLIDALDFAMNTGIDTLRGIAGLDVISYAVPVNFHLIFEAQ
ncbi:MAG: cellulose binding domain-containing protein [Pseudomonadota bacterium]